MKERITLEDARKLLQDCISPIIETQEVSLEEAQGRRVAEDVFASISQPPFPKSPIDGYACYAKDTKNASDKNPVELAVVGEIMAGEVFADTLENGQAVRIMTGAAIPSGLDCCIRQEDTNYGEKQVLLYKEMKSYENYCQIGEEYIKGDMLVEAGTRLGYIEMGILASTGKEKVLVYRKPSIALLTTGDELVLPNETRASGQIYNTNQYLLTGRLQSLGDFPIEIVHIKDDMTAVAKKMEELAGKVDIILTTGGVSVGKKDVFHQALIEANATKQFWKVQVKPGSPTLVSTLQGTMIISLSGNPLGAFIHFELLVREVLHQLTRDGSYQAQVKQAVLQDSFCKKRTMRRVVGGCYQKGEVFFPKAQDHRGISSLSGCNCLVDIPIGDGILKEGEMVQVWLL